MATHPSTLAWKVPWTEDHGERLVHGGHRQVRHNWATNTLCSGMTHPVKDGFSILSGWKTSNKWEFHDVKITWNLNSSTHTWSLIETPPCFKMCTFPVVAASLEAWVLSCHSELAWHGRFTQLLGGLRVAVSSKSTAFSVLHGVPCHMLIFSYQCGHHVKTEWLSNVTAFKVWWSMGYFPPELGDNIQQCGSCHITKNTIYVGISR